MCLPPLFFDGVQLPYSDTFKYLGMVCDIYRWIWILRLTQLCDHSWLVLSKSNNSSKAMTLLTNYTLAHVWLLKTYAIPAGMYASQIWATPGPFLRQGREKDNPIQKWLLKVLKWFLESETPLLSGRYVMRDCGLESLQFSWFRAAMCLYNFQTQCKSSTRSSAGFVLQCVCTIF